MDKYSILASQIENDTTASLPLLLEDEGFKNLFNKELKSTNNIFDSTKIIFYCNLKYINIIKI